MLILNFSHPLTEEQRQQIEIMTGQPIAEVRDIPSQMDHAQNFVHQIREMVNSLEISPNEWQTRPILVNPPAFNFAALTLLAELHGRMGYFPPIVRIRPVSGTTPPQYEVAEIINLQTVREEARKYRRE